MTHFRPTFEELIHPEKLPAAIREEVKQAVNHEPLNPINMANISWFNGAATPSYFFLPQKLTGGKFKILVLSGKNFPSGSHKVGPAYSILREKEMVQGITPRTATLVCPSTGNYGIGGAWVGSRLGYRTLVILPEEMSRERFELIGSYGAGIVKTPGCESNVKEIFDKVAEFRRQAGYVILEQFSEFGNYRFHYHVTGKSIEKILKDNKIKNPVGLVSAMGSAGSIAAGDYLKTRWKKFKIAGVEPIQCPTLYNLGVGPHRIEGIGDKHVTWIHNVGNMDYLLCIDDLQCLRALRLFQEGESWLKKEVGIDDKEYRLLKDRFGVSGLCNILASLKLAREMKLGADDTLVTFGTDGFDRYPSVLAKLEGEEGKWNPQKAKQALAFLHEPDQDFIQHGTPENRERWHNQKYFTWVEQQGKSVEEWKALKDQSFWEKEAERAAEVDQWVKEYRNRPHDELNHFF